MMAIDASVWISFVLPDDSNNRQTTEWVNTYVGYGGQMAVPALFLVEVASALRRRTDSLLDAEIAISKIKQEPLFIIHEMDERLVEYATRVALYQRLRGADAIYVALAQQLNVPLVTWDREQRERAGQFIQALSPAQALERMS